jgi:TatD DNase family protein
LQQSVFERQLLLAQKKKYDTVVIHCVAVFQEIVEQKNRLNTVPIIIHGFFKTYK